MDIIFGLLIILVILVGYLHNQVLLLLLCSVMKFALICAKTIIKHNRRGS